MSETINEKSESDVAVAWAPRPRSSFGLFIALPALIFALSVLHTPSVSAAPRMPQGFRTAVTNSSGKTWREIGSLPQPFAMARTTMKTAMIAQGYELVHDIAEGDNAIRRLLFWRREDEDVILMIWQEDLYTTGISWGISNRDDSEPHAPKPKGQ